MRQKYRIIDKTLYFSQRSQIDARSLLRYKSLVTMTAPDCIMRVQISNK